MITKERLDELKKEGAIVWQIKNNGEFNIALPIKLNYVTIKYLEEGIEVKSDVYMLFKISEAYDRIYFIRYDELTEDEEEANFINRYQGITRTETLSLPTFEEFCKYEYVDFLTSKGKHCWLEICLESPTSRFRMAEGSMFTHIWELTKENYIKACEICRKLFLGEEE